ncbi:GntR family transcriptional regulator [Cohnella pontilimi]|uniref:GntR family transcriptional regulator n=1 Tax=Cohnella pontilimi TaxID=2564100 RepID=A0A4U0FC38_9BACL|nr:GntR family transcriptional regulator [Cohnella pontilimi]TJY40802.1 GntR family transcriptional regulator [Cohnella pontilimi]
MRLPIRIDEQRPEPLYHQIEVQLRGLILGGELQEGTALPSIRELAVSLKCSAITIRRVYQDLEHEGLIRTRQGAGTFVARVETAELDRHRVTRVMEELEKAVEAGLALHCTIEEIEDAFRQIMRTKSSEQRGDSEDDRE